LSRRPARVNGGQSAQRVNMETLFPPVSDRDHLQGRLDAPIVLLEFCDYECPDCAAAHPVVKALKAQFGERLCYAYRHFPLIDIHPRAEAAAEVAEAAAAQFRFWEMHDLLLQHSPRLDERHLLNYAEEIGLDVEGLRRELPERHFLPLVTEDLDSGTRSGVRSTPTFFVNGVRYEGSHDFDSMAKALERIALAGRA
jgi:protein-disulfide isomerase